jgi:CO/xanthine dehydrogenase FAD-binding subunit
MKAERPEAVPIAGGTDVMVDVNFGRLRPPAFLDLNRVSELATVRVENGQIFLGAGVTYSRIVKGLTALPPLVQASRSVGSPQIRNRGTIGGNLGTSSPAGDTLPVLAVYDAEVVLRSRDRGERVLRWDRFLLGPKKTAIAPDELIIGARWQRPRGAGSFSKIGTRNAMVISVAGLCLLIDEDRQRVKVALGSVGPIIIRATEAEDQLSSALQAAGAWQNPMVSLPEPVIFEFSQRVAAAARPIDDVRGSAKYRRHACAVLAERALRWALKERTLPQWL